MLLPAAVAVHTAHTAIRAGARAILRECNGLIVLPLSPLRPVCTLKSAAFTGAPLRGSLLIAFFHFV